MRFLSGNESRIRVESQRIAGEDFEVWRWIQVATPKAHNPKLSRSVRIFSLILAIRIHLFIVLIKVDILTDLPFVLRLELCSTCMHLHVPLHWGIGIGVQGWHSGESTHLRTHQCGPGWIPRFGIICGLSLLVL